MKSILKLVFLLSLLTAVGLSCNGAFADDTGAVADVGSVSLETFRTVWNAMTRNESGLQLKGAGEPTNGDADYRGYPLTKDTVLYLITSDNHVVQAQLYGTKQEVKKFWTCITALLKSMEPTSSIPSRASVLKRLGFVAENKMPAQNCELDLARLHYSLLVDDLACELAVERTDANQATTASDEDAMATTMPAEMKATAQNANYATGAIIGTVAAYLMFAGIAIFFFRMLLGIFLNRKRQPSEVSIASLRSARLDSVDDGEQR